MVDKIERNIIKGMKKVLHNITIYFSLFIASLKEMLIYRLDCIVGIFSQLLTQVVELIFLYITFQNTEILAGWNFNQVLLLYGITMLSVGIADTTFDALYEIGPKYIKNGELDKILLRPVHPLISIIGSSKEFTSIGYFGLGLVMTIIMLVKLAIPITAILVLKIIFFSFIGAAIIGGIMVILSISSFWTYRSNEVIWTFFRTYTLAQYPIDIYNKFVKILITMILPFAFVAYYPTASYLGFESYMIYLSPVIAIVIWIVAVKTWNLALRKYRSTGT